MASSPAKKKTSRFGDLAIYRVDPENGNLIPSNLDHDPFDQTRDAEAFINDGVKADPSPLEDGEYFIIREVKRFTVSTIQLRTVEEVTNKLDELNEDDEDDSELDEDDSEPTATSSNSTSTND